MKVIDLKSFFKEVKNFIVMSLLNTISLKCDYSGKHFYIFNEEDYVEFVGLCNSAEFASSDKKTFHLMNNLNFNSVKRIDIIINEFKHIFDGEGCTISGLNIGLLTDAISGLFKVNIGTIKNLTVSGDVYGYQYAGGICAKNFGGKILDCVNRCNIHMPPDKVDNDAIYTYGGGICGELLCESTDHTEIYRCTNYGNVIGYAGLGGICGRQHSGDIVDCLNTVMPQCSTIYYGGISGNYFTGRIITSVNTAIVDIAEGNGGGIIGYIVPSNLYYKVVNCYYCARYTELNRGIGNTTILDKADTTIKLLSTDFCDKNKFSELSFGDIWSMYSTYNPETLPENDRPFLLNDGTLDGVKDITWFNPNITEHDVYTPMQVASLSDIVKLDAVKSHSLPYIFNQTQDINFNNKHFTKQIGKYAAPFKEIYNGNNFKMYNLKMNTVSDETDELNSLKFTALFGYNVGVIKNLIISEFTSLPTKCSSSLLIDTNEGNILSCYAVENVSGSKLGGTGILCGKNGENGSIINSFSINNNILNSDSTLTFTSNAVGGMCAFNYGHISNSFSYNTMNCTSDNTGGIAGVNFAYIDFCNNSSDNGGVLDTFRSLYPLNAVDFLNSTTYIIHGVRNVGGLVGLNYGIICNSNSEYGNVTGNENIGGLVGLNYQYVVNNEVKYVGKLKECMNNSPIDTHSLTSSSKNLGGIAGANYNSEIKDCYSYTNTIITCKNSDKNIGGLVGSFSGSLKTSYSNVTLPTSYEKNCGTIIGYLENVNPYISNETMFFNIENCYGKKFMTPSHTNIFSIGGNASTSLSYDIIGKAISLTAEESVLEESYVGFEFDNTWQIDLNVSPFLNPHLIRDSRNLVPKDNYYQYLGLPEKKFKGIFVDEIHGSLNAFNLYVDPDKNLVINGGCNDVRNEDEYYNENDLFYAPIPVNRGGTGSNVFETPGYVKANSTVPFTTINKIPDTDLTFNNNTTNNATTEKHGLLPKLDGSALKVLKGDGTWGSIENVEVTSSNALSSPTQLVNDLGEVSSTVNIDGNVANIHKLKVTGTLSITLTSSSALNVYRSFYLIITNGGNYFIEWPATVKWNGGIAPTLTNNGTDMIILCTTDAGATWYGFVNGANFS